MKKVLIAFDKFKDSMNAKTACVVAADVLAKRRPGWATMGAPLTDGGEGFCEIMTEAVSGQFHQLPVLGPRFRERAALFGRVRLERVPPLARRQLDLPDQGDLAIIEMAQASGLEMLRPADRDALQATSYGTGELLAFAIEQNADAILLGIGGSATSDLGLGALEAMGLQFFNEHGEGLNSITPQRWPEIAGFGGNLLHPARQGLPPIRIACDVTNPLLGEKGAAAVYGPQKGLKPESLAFMEEEGRRIAEMLCRYFEQPPELMEQEGAGAAGGIGFGLMAGAEAKLVPGFALVTAWLQLEKRMAESDIVLTGEGKFDASSLHGKGPFAVLEMAKAAEVGEVHLYAGAVEVDNLDALSSQFPTFSSNEIAHPDWSLEENLARGPERLKAALEATFHET